ncbi:TPA: hypothetical protein HA265_02655 [Candidatus Woesearchaeota archaeon]|nr:hypothetical protein [Candidatus Woesearchaeota archaeon]
MKQNIIAKSRPSAPSLPEVASATKAGQTEPSVARRSRARLCIIGLGLIALLLFSGCSSPNLDDFAKCVNSTGMKMYGTFWCPHCQNVKKSFGTSFEFIDYTECDEGGPKGNPLKCQYADVKGYPTFIFGDGMRIEGEMSIGLIADKTGCELPE